MSHDLLFSRSTSFFLSVACIKFVVFLLFYSLITCCPLSIIKLSSSFHSFLLFFSLLLACMMMVCLCCRIHFLGANHFVLVVVICNRLHCISGIKLVVVKIEQTASK